MRQVREGDRAGRRVEYHHGTGGLCGGGEAEKAEGGDEGGKVVAIGTPEEVAKVKESYTGKFLVNELKKTQ